LQSLLEIIVPTLLFATILAIYLTAGGDLTPKQQPAEFYSTDYSVTQFCKR
jgi:hypothetical protein